MFGFLSKNKEGIFNIGLLEMAIAIYPIISGYGYGSVSGSSVMRRISELSLVRMTAL